MILVGGPQCGPNGMELYIADARVDAYKRLADYLRVDITGEKLDCVNMEPFEEKGSTNPALYWDPEECCSIVQWQTGYNALVVGYYHKCLERAKEVGKNCNNPVNPRFFK